MLYQITYYCTILICISLGSCYKKIEDQEMKRNYGAGLGVLVTCLVCGHYIIHTVIMVWGNIIIIKCCDRRYVHQISLAYTWLHLLYLHFNLLTSTYVIWLHQTMALRLVGLAFEINLHERSKTESKLSKAITFLTADEDSFTEPKAVDIIAYAYYFIGLHRGPYYKWKIFNDHFKEPFGVLGDCRIITEQKCKKAFIYFLGLALLRMRYSSDIYNDDDFYVNYPTDFRYLFNIPQLLIYFLQYNFLMLLCTGVCTEAGFGVYPAKCQPLPGQGPSAKLSLLSLATSSPAVALEQEYNFTMLKCFDNEKLLLGPSMHDTTRSWDMPTRYWFWSNIYKNLVKASKEVRNALSFLTWTIWCGPTLQQMILASTLWVHLHLEAEFRQLYNTGGSLKTAWDIGFSIMRAFCLIYLTPCLVIDDSATVLKYYTSIFWAYHIVLVIFIIAAIVISKAKMYA